MWHFIRKFLLVLLIILGLCILGGYLYQTISLQQDKKILQPPGKLFKVGNNQIHLYCTGSGSPTVILEAASGGMQSSWGWIQPEVSKHTRVCSYDRRGRGWSSGDNTNISIEEVAKDLHAVLWAAQINDKYILVGHSLGGIYTRKYQERYSNEVVGMVLIDASHPRVLITEPEVLEKTKSAVDEFRTYEWLARIGLPRLYLALGGQLDFYSLPEKERKETAYFWSTPEHYSSMAREYGQIESIYQQGQSLESLDDIPVRIISAADAKPEWERLQNDLFNLSKDSTRITIPDSTHMSLVFDKNHAARVSAVINTLADSLKE